MDFFLIIIAALSFIWVQFFPDARPLDPEPIVATLEENVLPAGMAQVGFTFNTGGDQLGMRKEAGLGWVVHYGNTYHYQQFESCGDDMGTDNTTIFPLTMTCDGRLFKLAVDGQLVTVTEVDEQGVIIRRIAEVSLPETITNVQPDTESELDWAAYDLRQKERQRKMEEKEEQMQKLTKNSDSFK